MNSARFALNALLETTALKRFPCRVSKVTESFRVAYRPWRWDGGISHTLFSLAQPRDLQRLATIFCHLRKLELQIDTHKGEHLWQDACELLVKPDLNPSIFQDDFRALTEFFRLPDHGDRAAQFISHFLFARSGMIDTRHPYPEHPSCHWMLRV